MKTKGGLFLIILIITIRAGFAQEVQEEIEYPNLVKNGDFESGATDFKSDFIYTDTSFNPGNYIITKNIIQYMGSDFVNPVPNTGKYYAINVNNSGKQRLWYDSITVKPNTTYSFNCILANVNAKFEAPGLMSLKVNSKKVSPLTTLSNGSCAWIPLNGIYHSGSDETRIEISIVDHIWILMGNDVALDNIVFKEIPPEVIQENSFNNNSERKKTDSTETQEDCKPYFQFDKVEHYFLAIDKDKIWEMENRKERERTKKENKQLELLIHRTPDKLSDTIFIKDLEKIDFVKTEIQTDKFEQLNKIFCERKYEITIAPQCMAIYRDILVFKNDNKIIGIAKICFECGKKVITGTDLNTSQFGQSGDYAKLYKILH